MLRTRPGDGLGGALRLLLLGHTLRAVPAFAVPVCVPAAVAQAIVDRADVYVISKSRVWFWWGGRDDRQHALNRLRGLSQNLASEVEKAHRALVDRVKALSAETDNRRLLEVALEGEFDVLRVGAAERLTDQAALERAAVQASDREVLKTLLAKLEDKAVLNRIAATANDRAMRLAAAHKAGARSWREVFDAASARGADAHMLADALAAASLFPGKQADAVTDVQHACISLIRLGDESRIPEMVDLLEAYGDKALAEDYLNCGQPDLDETARTWAHLRGLYIETGSGSNRARWGSGR